MKGQLRFEALVDRKGFTVAPNVVLTSPYLSCQERVLYLLLRHYARQDGQCFPGLQRLAEQMRTARTSLSPMLKHLQEVGLIAIHRRGQGETNTYSLPPITDAVAERLLSTADDNRG